MPEIEEQEITDGEVTNEVVILGCSNGHIFKFENKKGQGGWTRTGALKLANTVSDVL